MHDFDDMNPETEADIAEGTGEARTPRDEEVIRLRAALAESQEALAKARNDYLRAHADFDNFRKRMRAERDQEFSRGGDRVLADLLPVLDDFERALAAVNEASTLESLQQGVTLIYRNLQSLLDRYGLLPMEVIGQPFDPKFHDAAASVTTSDAPDHTIVSELQRGYLKNGETFRPAKVVVAMQPFEGQG